MPGYAMQPGSGLGLSGLGKGRCHLGSASPKIPDCVILPIYFRIYLSNGLTVSPDPTLLLDSNTFGFGVSKHLEYTC